jgi:hypothetical protein
MRQGRLSGGDACPTRDMIINYPALLTRGPVGIAADPQATRRDDAAINIGSADLQELRRLGQRWTATSVP